MVSQYSGLDMEKVLDFPVDKFSLYYKNQYIENMMKTEEGREYLEKCKRMQETDIDISAFRKAKRKGG